MIAEEDLPETIDDINYDIDSWVVIKHDDKNSKKYIPENITETENIFSVNFHPKLNLISLGLINGETKIYKYSIDKPNTLLATFNNHKESVRKVCFSDNGKLLYTASSDRALGVIDCKQAKVKYSIKDAHGVPISTFIVIDDNTVVTGDDEGLVRIWDTRQRYCAKEFNEHGDYISGFDYSPQHNKLFCCSADGSISVMSLNGKNSKGIGVTLGVNDDYTGILCLKDGKDVIAAGASGTIYHYDHEQLYESKRNMKSFVKSISCLLQVNETTYCYGSDDGDILAHSLQTGKRMRMCDGMDSPILDMSISRDAKYIASCSFETVKFHNALNLYNLSLVEQIEEVDESKEGKQLKKEEAKLEKKYLNIKDDNDDKKKRKKAGGVQEKKKKVKVFNSERKQFLHDLLTNY
ncbi:hypothetical protein ABK040_012426 [Willaertia magna]